MGMRELLFSFEGRVNRAKYIGAGLIATAFFMLVLLPAVFAVEWAQSTGHRSDAFVAAIFAITLVPVYVGMLWASLALSIKRLHDCDCSGWLVLLSLIPIVGLILSLYLLFADGTWGENRYGSDVRYVPWLLSRTPGGTAASAPAR